MKIGGLTLFGRMHSNHEPIRGRVLACWHSPRSITWRWGLNWTPEWRGMPLGLHWWGRWGCTWGALLRLPFIGVLSIGVQQSLFPRRYPLPGFPLRGANARRNAIREHEQCPECGGSLDTGDECNECSYEAWRDLRAPHAI